MKRLLNSFFQRDVLVVAPELLGKVIVRKFENGTIHRYVITEVEAYRGEDDLACHASKGKTARTEVMYHDGGKVYVYLIYGMYWMLNFVTGIENYPSAVLIRGVDSFSGPGRVGRGLQLDKSFYGEDLGESNRIWVEDAESIQNYRTDKRIGIDYAGDIWANKNWRFFI